MTIYIAYETLNRLEQSLFNDQGSAYRGWLGKVIPHMGDAFRQGEEGHRGHMGASVIGGECARAIAYGWRWVTKKKHPGRIVRLFNRGHLEEARFIALLLSIGCEVYQQDAEGNQFRISHASGHFGGSGDGVAINIPDLLPDQATLLEFKTHGEKSFIELAGKLEEWRKHIEAPRKAAFTGKGVKDAKYEHYVQMQIYMRKMGLASALYMAVCKNTDDIYAEIVPLDSATADEYLSRGEKLIEMQALPNRINSSPGFYKCRFCDHRPVCHLGAEPDRNCRTCEYAVPVISHEPLMPETSGRWLCRKHDNYIGKNVQLIGCSEYEKSKIFK